MALTDTIFLVVIAGGLIYLKYKSVFKKKGGCSCGSEGSSCDNKKELS